MRMISCGSVRQQGLTPICDSNAVLDLPLDNSNIRSKTYLILCVCVSNPVPKGMFIQVVMHAELKNRGQQGVHSSAANEDSCEYSVKQIETSICVPVSLTSFHRSSKRLSSEPQKRPSV